MERAEYLRLLQATLDGAATKIDVEDQPGERAGFAGVTQAFMRIGGNADVTVLATGDANTTLRVLWPTCGNPADVVEQLAERVTNHSLDAVREIRRIELVNAVGVTSLDLVLAPARQGGS